MRLQLLYDTISLLLSVLSCKFCALKELCSNSRADKKSDTQYQKKNKNANNEALRNNVVGFQSDHAGN